MFKRMNTLGQMFLMTLLILGPAKAEKNLSQERTLSSKEAPKEDIKLFSDQTFEGKMRLANTLIGIEPYLSQAEKKTLLDILKEGLVRYSMAMMENTKQQDLKKK